MAGKRKCALKGDKNTNWTGRQQRWQRNWTRQIDKQQRGWPVVVTGSGGIVHQRSYAAWRGHMGFPDESPDFSDQDVFDVAFFLIEKQKMAAL